MPYVSTEPSKERADRISGGFRVQVFGGSVGADGTTIQVQAGTLVTGSGRRYHKFITPFRVNPIVVATPLRTIGSVTLALAGTPSPGSFAVRTVGALSAGQGSTSGHWIAMAPR